VTKLRPGRVVLGAIGLGVGVVAVMSLREATLSTHEPVTGKAMELVVSADSKGGERSQHLAEMVEAQLQTCRLEVNSDLAGPIEYLGRRRFRAVLTPAMDETDRRQFRGCVEDFMIDHVQINMIRFTVAR
jgi:hypothetical protein